MTKIQNSKPVSVIWNWNLRFVCNLVLGVWDFIDSTSPLLQQTPASRKDPQSLAYLLFHWFLEQLFPALKKIRIGKAALFLKNFFDSSQVLIQYPATPPLLQ